MSPAHSGESLPSRQLIASAFQCYRMIHFSSACLQIGAAGASASGQLGNGGNAGSPTPTVVLNGYVWSQVSAGGLHSCGLTSGSLVPYCWGACMHESSSFLCNEFEWCPLTRLHLVCPPHCVLSAQAMGQEVSLELEALPVTPPPLLWLVG